jgi:hypothetical protein
MFKSHIYEDNVPIVYETRRPTYFSMLRETAFNKAWEPWDQRYFALREDSTLIYRKTRDSPITAKLDLSKTKISKLAMDGTPSDLMKKEVGIVMTCKHDGIETNIRCILQEVELHAFLNAIRAFVENSIIDEDTLQLESSFAHKSFMRQSLTEAIDSFQNKNKIITILNRRGKILVVV